MKKGLLTKIFVLFTGLGLSIGTIAAINNSDNARAAKADTGDTYSLVTEAPSDWSGTYLFAYVNGTSAYVYNGTDSGANNGVSTTVKDDKITWASGMTEIVVESMSGGYSLKVNSGTNNGKYLSGGTSNGTTFNSNKVANSVSFNTNGTVKINNNTNTSFQFNSASDQQRFRYFKSEQKSVSLFLKDDGTSGTTKTIASVSLKTNPKSVYNEGEYFDPTNLEITVTYSDNSSETISYSDHASDFTFSPSLATRLMPNNTNIEITYFEKTINFSITVNELIVNHYTLSGEISGECISDTWDFSNLVLKAYTDVEEQNEKNLVSDLISFECSKTPSEVVGNRVEVVAKYNGNSVKVTEVSCTISNSKTISMSSFSEVSGSLDSNVSYRAVKGSGTTNPAISSNKIRIYKPSSGNNTGGEIFISVPSASSYLITDISITSNRSNSLSYILDGVGDFTSWKSSGSGTYVYSLSSVSFKEIRIVNTCSDSNDISKIEVTYTKEIIRNPITSFSDIVLNTNSAAFASNTTVTATVTINPSNTDEIYSWSSSNTNVATIAKSTTAGVANISIVGVGTCTFTISNKTGSITKTSETFTVTNAVEPEHVSCSVSELLNDATGNYKTMFRVTGYIKEYVSGYNKVSDTGSFILGQIGNDSASILVYYSSANTNSLTWDGEANKYHYENIADFNTNDATKDLTLGDKVTLDVCRCDYGGTKEVRGIVVSSVKEKLNSISVTNLHTSSYGLNQIVKNTDFTVVGHYEVKGDANIDSADCTISHDPFTSIGNYNVTVSYNGVSDSYVVSVEDIKIAVTGIAIENDELNVPVGGTYSFGASLEPFDTSYDLTYELDPDSDANVITINDDDTFTAIGSGTVIVNVGTTDPNYTDYEVIMITAYKDISYTLSDEVTISTTGVTSGSYTNFSDKTSNSTAVFAGKCLKNVQKNSSGCIQLNKNSGAIWTTVSGGTIRTITVDFADANNNTLKIYGSNTAYSSLVTSGTPSGTVIASFTANGSYTIENDVNYKYIYVYASAAMYINKLTFSWDIKASQADVDAVDSFVGNALKMNTIPVLRAYTPSEDCVKNFNNFLTAYGELTPAQKAIFGQSSYYSDARERAVAWATANGYEGTFDDAGTFTANKQDVKTFFNDFAESDSSMAIIVAVIGLSSLGASVLFIRKRKHA